MIIVHAKPPNFDAIAAVFAIKDRRGVVFAWGDTLYNPDRIPITVPLMTHEIVHGRRQGGEPGAWWRQYLDDPQFRLTEEVFAHQAEYRAFCAHGSPLWKKRREYLNAISRRLSGALYGSMISFGDASKLIQAQPT